MAMDFLLPVINNYWIVWHSDGRARAAAAYLADRARDLWPGACDRCRAASGSARAELRTVVPICTRTRHRCRDDPDIRVSAGLTRARDVELDPAVPAHPRAWTDHADRFFATRYGAPMRTRG